jgi:saccharopine dehydrogenase-like NADP-dependent oxidoreductase
MKTVVILGGAGDMSDITVKDLIYHNKTANVVIADINLDRAEQRAKELGSDRVSAKYVDLNDGESIRVAIKNSDIVMNCALSKYNLSVMKAALDVGTDYLDLSALPGPTLEQMKLDQDFRKANLIAIIGMGAAPGISNLMARFAYDRLDHVESVSFRFANKSLIKSSLPIRFPYNAYALLGQVDNKSFVFDDGKLREVESLTGEEYVDFPEPIGKVETVYLGHPEPASLSVTFLEKGLKHVDVKIHVSEDLKQKVSFLKDLGFASVNPIKIADHETIPREFVVHLMSLLPKEESKPNDVGCYIVNVVGEKNGKRKRFVMKFMCRSRGALSSTAVRTGTPIAIGAQMILNEELKMKGAFPPDICINPEAFFRELARRHLYISWEAEEFI